MKTINYDLLSDKSNMEFYIGTDIGGREQQQDCACVVMGDDEAFAAVCDGMGGLNGGRLASRTVISLLREQYLLKNRQEEFPAFFERMLEKADEKVFFLEDKYKKKLEAGTTLVAAGISGRNLYWLSVGDSRLYIKRGDELVQVTRDHNYFFELDDWLEKGIITQEQYEQEEKKGEALISYVGMGEISVFDLSRKPVALKPGDILLLTTDGLWKILADEVMFRVLDADDTLENKARRLLKMNAQAGAETDNMTFVLMRMMPGGENNEEDDV